MYRLKNLLITAAWIFIVQTLHAQQHYNAWFRGTFHIPAGTKFSIDNEFQYRRQNGFGNPDLFDKKLMLAYRSWIHYQQSENVKFSLSPVAYFSNYKIIQKQADEYALPNREIRFSAAVEMQHRIFKNFYAANRMALEYRMFENQSNITRLRNRFYFRYDFTAKTKLSVFDEPLFNITGTTHDHFFDHNRIGFDLEYKVLPYLKFDTGYMHIIRTPLQSTTTLYESNIFLNITYQLHQPRKIDRVHAAD